MAGEDKQVSFEDGHSSASDEDAKAVEVKRATSTAPTYLSVILIPSLGHV